MRKWFVVLALLALPWQAFAQGSIQPLPASANLAATSDAVTGLAQQYPSFTFQLAGTWTGTVTFEGRTQESLSYVSILATSVTDGSLSSTATANGAWTVFNGGYSSVRARFSTATSGTVIASITPGFAQARVASPQFVTGIANTWCMSATTKDSYWQEVAANDPGLFTGGTACAGGTVRLDVTSTRALFAVPVLTPAGTVGAPGVQVGEATTGFHRPSAGVIGLSFAGTGYTFSAVDASNFAFKNAANTITAFSVFGDATHSVWLRHDGTDGFVQTNGGSTSLKLSGDGGGNYLTLAGASGTWAGTSWNSPTINATTAFQANGTPGVTGTCDTPTVTQGIVTTCGGSGNSVDGTYFVTGNFTTANNTNFQLITGLAWTFPALSAVNTPFRCSLTYSQATAVVSDSLGIQDVTVAPTNGMFTGSAETALGTTAYGDLTAFSSTTATAVVTFTPSAIGTIFVAYIDGLIEQPSNASTSAFQIQIKTTTGADAITVYRGSYCKVG